MKVQRSLRRTIEAELSDKETRAVECFGKLGEPLGALCRGTAVHYSIHACPPALIECSVPELARFALHPIHSGAETV